MPHTRVLPSLRRGQLCPRGPGNNRLLLFHPCFWAGNPTGQLLVTGLCWCSGFPTWREAHCAGDAGSSQPHQPIKDGPSGLLHLPNVRSRQAHRSHLLGPCCPWVEIQATSLREQTIPAPRWVHAEPRSVT